MPTTQSGDRALTERETHARAEQSLAEQVPALVFRAAADGRLLESGAGWQAYRGREPNEDLGEGWFQGVHPEDLERLRGEFVGAAANGHVLECEFRLRRYDGAFRWMLLQGSLVYDEDGHVESVACVCTDITRLRHEQNSLSDRLALFDTLIMNAPVGFAFLDPELRFLSVNPAMAELNRRTVTEPLGRRPTEVFGDEAGAQLEGYVRQAIETGKALRDVELSGKGSAEAGQAEGAWLANYYPIFGPSGDCLGVGSLVIDISDRRAAEEQLERTAEELRHANEAKDEVLGLVSHELRTPLTTLRGNANALGRHRQNLTQEQWAEALADIEAEAERLQQIVENMLILARVEGSDEFEVEPVRLNRLVDRAVADHLIRYSGCPVEVHQEELPPALGHAIYIRQVLTNLLSNAAKYSPPGSPIDVEVKRSGDMALIRVLDRGAGIDPAEIEHVFNPFYRAKDTAKRASGMGLGLAVCRRLVEIQGGTITIAPRPGGGTSAQFTVPLILEEPPE
ncbi:MAG: PAS domain-containing protein [Hyphomicrobiales bacterium]